MAKTRDKVRNEALETLRKFRRAGAGISVGVGKTRLGLDHFQLVEKKVQTDENRTALGLVAAPTKKIIQGWKDEAKKWNVEHLLDGLVFTTYRSLPKQKLDYDVIYLDECHSLKSSSHDAWLNKFEGFIVGLTGTPPKYKTTDRAKMVAKYCPIKYEYLTDAAIDDGVLNDYRITVHLLELSEIKNYKVSIKGKDGKPGKSWYTSEYENYNYWTGRCRDAYSQQQKMTMGILRMNAMKGYPTKDEYAKRLLDQSKDRCILFANTMAQADKLCKHSYHSDNKDSEANMALFESGKVDKLSCVFQLSEGANIKGLRECIILHAYGNNRKSAQRIGRMLRLNPNETAHIHILCFKDTQDMKWVTEALDSFEKSKISWYDPDIF